MRKHVCDICHKTEQYCRYEIKKRWKLLEHNWDSGGGYNYRMDICDSCFEYIVSQRRKWKGGKK